MQFFSFPSMSPPWQPVRARAPRTRRGPNQFPGIVEAAQMLGVDRVHLWRVLTGERKSPLLDRYHDLMARRAGK